MKDLSSLIRTQLQVEKKLLEPPKPTKHEKSPPPKKLTSATTNAGVTVLKTKKTRNASNNQNLIAKSKTTIDVTKIKESTAQAKPPPPVNLLKTQRPPLEIHKIEGDKIIIIRRVPRAQRPAANCDLKHKSLPTFSPASANQVIKSMYYNHVPFIITLIIHELRTILLSIINLHYS